MGARAYRVAPLILYLEMVESFMPIDPIIVE